MNRKIFLGVILGLLSIGTASGIMILYDYLNGPHLLSKEQVIENVFKVSKWSKDQLSDKIIDTKLLQVKNMDIGLVVNEKTFAYEMVAQGIPTMNVAQDQYIWEVRIVKKIDENNQRIWSYFMDASNGTLLFKDEPSLDKR